MTDAANTEGTQVQEAKAGTATKAKVEATGNLIFDTAAELEQMSKTKVLNLATKLADSIETNFFRLGGALKQIKEQSWYEGHETFGAYVAANFDFQERKALYLIEIYSKLVQAQVDWSVVAPLGWTKLKELAKVLTAENAAEWVAKALPLTVAELKALLTGPVAEGTGTTSAKTTSDSSAMKFVLKADQVQNITTALNKAKAEAGTEFDSVALDTICLGYLGGSVDIAKPTDLASLFKEAGWQKVLEVFGQVFDYVDLDVTAVNEPGVQQSTAYE